MALNLNVNNATVNYPFRDRQNDRLTRHASLTGPAAYATGGIAIDNQGDFGWGETHALFGSIWDGSALYVLHLDYANQKVLVVDPTTGAEVANGTNLSTFLGQIVAYGK